MYTMLARRNWVLRLSIILNVAVLLYVGTHIASKGGGADFLEELQDSGRNLAFIDLGQQQQQQQQQQSAQGTSEGGSTRAESSPRTFDNHLPPAPQSPSIETQSSHSSVPSTIQTKKVPTKPTGKDVSTTPELSAPSEVVSSTKSEQLIVSESALQPLEELIKCHDKSTEPRTAQRSDFWVLYNYVTPSRKYRCFESITYTTHADYTFLDNLGPLLDRWRGPVSLAMHAPGADFAPTVEAIRYARDCLSPLVAEYVTFHVFFGSRHVPKQVPAADKVTLEQANCSLPAPWTNVTSSMLYKSKSKILYPVNIGRNIAREMAVTHYILPSDIELYPSPGLIIDFLQMVQRQDPPLKHTNPKVFPLSIFELQTGAELPLNKVQLVSMMNNGTAIQFHKKLCPGCHNVPKSKEWLTHPVNPGLHVFHIGKRTGYFVHWEPIFIGTHSDPLYDERLSWEGKSDKMTQSSELLATYPEVPGSNLDTFRFFCVALDLERGQLSQPL
ncbi:unnamed protein product [Timema podura]|uniref:Glycosyltransferase n=1 Tax=Timema podura TaxID=61482 RepID=A0ABN7NTP5_TIMPD|nr:unnamed protein product [Timema podura]